MAVEVHVRKLKRSWQYDFKQPGHGRERKGGYRTKAAAFAAGQKRLQEIETGAQQILFADAFAAYMAASTMKARSRDAFMVKWRRIEPELGHLFIEDVGTTAMDRLKRALPAHLSANTVNHYLALVSAVLHFMWKRERLSHVPYVPKEHVPKKVPEWYSQEERDRLMDGFFAHEPEWYLFYYLTVRLGLRVGEVYAISHRQVRQVPPQLVVDQAVQKGSKSRPALIVTRKNNEAYVLDLTQDVLDAIEWHIQQGYAGPEFLFSQTGEFPRYIDSYVKPLLRVQRTTGLRKLCHHAVGRHSVASQAVTMGEGIKVVQAQLGHRSAESTDKYAHLGGGAQLRLIKALEPDAPPHVNVVSTRKAVVR